MARLRSTGAKASLVGGKLTRAFERTNPNEPPWKPGYNGRLPVGRFNGVPAILLVHQSSMNRLVPRAAAVIAALFTCANLAAGQASSQSRRTAFAINPLGIPFEIVSVELESAIHDAFTIAGNFSYFSPDEFTRSSFEVKGRLYPNERAPAGFSVGLGLGGVNTRENLSIGGVETKQDKTHPSLGVYVDYNWLLGKNSRFYVGTGVGAKRIIGDADEFDDAPFVYGTARFLIGVAF